MSQWLPLPSQPECQQGDVYLIGMSYVPGAYSDEDLQFLSIIEQQQAARFKFDIHRERYTFFHICLRKILAQLLHCSPGALVFHRGAHGKPSLDNTHQLKFNLSHSEDEGMLAVTKAAEIGVDIEKIKNGKDDEGVAARFFSETENAYLQQFSGEEKTAAFYQLWAHKEAFIKATGKGVSQNLKSFSVGLCPSRLIRAGDTDYAEWTLHSFKWKEGFMSAFAIHQVRPNIHYYHFT